MGGGGGSGNRMPHQKGGGSRNCTTHWQWEIEKSLVHSEMRFTNPPPVENDCPLIFVILTAGKWGLNQFIDAERTCGPAVNNYNTVHHFYGGRSYEAPFSQFSLNVCFLTLNMGSLWQIVHISVTGQFSAIHAALKMNELMHLKCPHVQSPPHIKLTLAVKLLRTNPQFVEFCV